MKIRKMGKDHKKYYDGRLKYIAPTSKYEFINLFDDRTKVDFEEIKTQIIKLREEFYELMAEPIYTIEFQKELFDLINAGINLSHCLSLYYNNFDNTNKHNKFLNDWEVYNMHVNKINHRLLDNEYNWGINLEKEILE
jgi:hypothetical protein